mgnify:CR=1 FL=1|tara:strand:- start:5090 stop:5296 length:207 start_codon:yes stop_codon:yes gene_type:complete
MDEDSYEDEDGTVEYVDITPKWIDVVPALIDWLTDTRHTKKSRDWAINEIIRMAKLADLYATKISEEE